MLISEDYRELNRQLHTSRADFGKQGSRWGELVFGICASLNTKDVLDYGCGKAELNLAMPFSIKNYDPAVAKYEDPPNPANVVVCTDVLEHIEPECLRDVLNDLQRLTKQVLVLCVATRPAVKKLADGRNAHLIQQPYTWWEPKLLALFDVIESTVKEGEFLVVMKPKGSPL